MSQPLAQSTSNILMVRPATFRKNEETASNNHYQKDADVEDVHDAALDEFDGMVEDLRSRGVNVIVVRRPFHGHARRLVPQQLGELSHRRTIGLPHVCAQPPLERREDILHDLVHAHGFVMNEIVDFTEFEGHDAF